jgi:hypothetical protein
VSYVYAPIAAHGDPDAVLSMIGQALSPIEVDSDKTGRMWYTALRKEGARPGRYGFLSCESAPLAQIIWGIKPP